MPDDSSSGSGMGSGSGAGGSAPAASLEDHNAKTGIVRWPHAKRPKAQPKPKRRTGNRLLDLID